MSAEGVGEEGVGGPSAPPLRAPAGGVPKQTSLFLYALPRGGSAAAEAEAERLLRERVAARKAHAERLGLPWPRPAGRKVGRPSRAQQYQEALYTAIEGDSLPESATAEMPGWWEKDLPLELEEGTRVALAAPVTPEAQASLGAETPAP